MSRPRDPEEASFVQALVIRAESGDIEALYELGALYDMGSYVGMDSVRASRLFKEAADKGHSHSMWIHACELLWGHGSFPQNIEDGIRYLNGAIEGGSAQACITKARLHMFGELGVPKSEDEAKMYRSMARKLDPDIFDPLSNPEYLERIRNAIRTSAT